MGFVVIAYKLACKKCVYTTIEITGYKLQKHGINLLKLNWDMSNFQTIQDKFRTNPITSI